MRNHVVKRMRLADTFFLRLIGLMGKVRWPIGYDVLMFRNCRYLHTCFTFLRPDLIFTTKDGKVISVSRKTGPWKISGSFSARHSFEARPGFIDRHQIKVGDCLRFKD
jgi:uncharacterized membrane protein (UPF0127 family)